MVKFRSTRQISPRAGLAILFFHHVPHTKTFVSATIAIAKQVGLFFQFEDGNGKLTGGPTAGDAAGTLVFN